MKLRIERDSIKFKVSKEQANQLLADEVLLDAVPLTSLLKLTYSVEVTEHLSKFEYSEIDHCLSLRINRDILQKELTEGPTKKGILIEHDINDSKYISVGLQVDLKTS
ncbi:hypothetical protein FLL45_06220 [Aliikangiella marina]|uniref:Uncharacterized protein n=1 Tax=Aliikangiella marina TaxID=1712262 RepID=A0A545TK22_9GAMM|nr:hypothetical protein [Aliikangiella marina]TQV77536.1 hypothetical protein FLL45_06220 [Aliikangiella marina]